MGSSAATLSPHGGRRNAIRRGRLLPGELEGEFAAGDALGEAGGEFGGRVLAVRGDELAQGGEQACLRHAVAVDAVEPGFGPGLVQVADRDLLLLMLR